MSALPESSPILLQITNLQNNMADQYDQVSSTDSVEIDGGPLLQHISNEMKHMVNAAKMESMVASQVVDVDGSQPYLKIVEQPQSRGFRFRYKCEGPSHGGLQGVSSSRSKKAYPAIKIMNYTGPARIVVNLVTDELVPRIHVHELVGKNCDNGTCLVEVKSSGDGIISFPNMGIMHVTKKNVANVLEERIVHSMQLDHQVKLGKVKKEFTLTDTDRKQASEQAEKQAKAMQLNVVRLCYQAYLMDEDGNFTRMLPSVLSDTVYDSKSPRASALRICRMDKSGGCCVGNEEVFLLCERVQKDDIQVRFFEVNDSGDLLWEDFGNFGAPDVHRQYAIVFKTPPYRDIHIRNTVHVFIQLRRPSDLEASEPKAFNYYPQDFDKECIGRKRRKLLPGFPPGYGPGDSSNGGGGMGPPYGPGAKFIGFSASEPGERHYGQGEDNSLQYNNLSHHMPSYHFHTSCVNEPLPAPVSLSSPLSPTVQVKTQTHASASVHLKNSVIQLGKRTTLALHEYSMTGDIRPILMVQRHLTNTTDVNGDTPLQMAIINGQQEVVSQLLNVMKTIPEAQKRVNSSNDLRQTPLHLAVLTQQPEIIDLLLKAGADPAMVDHCGNTPSHLAIERSSIECLRAMTRYLRPGVTQDKPFPELDLLNYDGLSTLHMAMQSSNLEMVKLLTEQGKADVDMADLKSGRTPLHYAAEAADLSILGYLLLEACVDVNKQTFDNNTALHLATARNHMGVVALLISANADPDLENDDMGVIDDDVDGENSSDDDSDSGDSMGSPSNYSERPVPSGNPGHMTQKVFRHSNHVRHGETPKDLARHSEKILRILNGEPYSRVCMTQAPPILCSGLLCNSQAGSLGILRSIDGGYNSISEISYIDQLSRAKLSHLLDPAKSGSDWQTLAEALHLGHMIDILKAVPSPTKLLLDQYRKNEGTLSELKECLQMVGCNDAVNIINDVMQQVHELYAGHLTYTSPTGHMTYTSSAGHETFTPQTHDIGSSTNYSQKDMWRIDSGLASMSLSHGHLSH